MTFYSLKIWVVQKIRLRVEGFIQSPQNKLSGIDGSNGYFYGNWSLI